MNHPAAPNGQAGNFGLNDSHHLFQSNGKDNIYCHKMKKGKKERKGINQRGKSAIRWINIASKTLQPLSTQPVAQGCWEALCCRGRTEGTSLPSAKPVGIVGLENVGRAAGRAGCSK